MRVFQSKKGLGSTETVLNHKHCNSGERDKLLPVSGG